ncbi:HD domain-containing phosphohydrolase [Psychromonas sp. CD1]|uniref:HD domain-containing phosphohydrolase n=1 Tax=Psychromonas sp. CD1 TaxID=1979839 RepID=UPI000B9A53B4|nr:HD domain-containing phosphohydrolase [Psychromonas sp. CD1]
MDWLADEDSEEKVSDDYEYYNILIVDDEKDIHLSTILTMKRFMFEDKKMRFFHAYSAQQARQLLLNDEYYALVLLDVVMENDHAGLELARFIRQDLNNRFTRIILRTGQPGLAPEQKVIRDFDIDGYKSKTELRVADLESFFYTSLRAYRDICLLQKHRKMLEQVINSIAYVSGFDDLYDFVPAVFSQIKLVLKVSSMKDIIETKDIFAISKVEGKLNVFSANAHGIELFRHENMDALKEKEQFLFDKALAVKKSFNDDDYYVYFHKSHKNTESIFSFEVNHPLEITAVNMIDLFLRNVLLCYENLLLLNKLKETQELVFTILGGTMESHSKETGKHVVRVGLYSNLLAKLNGEKDSYCENIRLAAQLHDVGKVGVPDNILHKKGPLDKDEWEEMKLHVIKGWDILNIGDDTLITMASHLARDHHEKWDGSGYPNGKKYKEISLEGRITAIADVFDALCSVRCYKKAWTLSDTKIEIKKSSGSHFDPKLCELFIENFTLFADIYQQNIDP